VAAAGLSCETFILDGGALLYGDGGEERVCDEELARLVVNEGMGEFD
jgi:hypothetical protein